MLSWFRYLNHIRSGRTQDPSLILMEDIQVGAISLVSINKYGHPLVIKVCSKLVD